MLLGIHWAPSVCANRSENNHTRKQKRQWQLRSPPAHRNHKGQGQLCVPGELAAVKGRMVSWAEGQLVRRSYESCYRQSLMYGHFPMLCLHFQVCKTGSITMSPVRKLIRELRNSGSRQTYLFCFICWFYQNCLQGQRSNTPESTTAFKPTGRKALESPIFENGLQEG